MEKPGSPFFNFFRRLFQRYEVPPSPTVPVGGDANYMIIGTTFDRNSAVLLRQQEEARKYRGFIEEAARSYNFQPCIICGIGSRESGWGLNLRPPGPGGRGDFAKRKPKDNRTTPEPPDGPGYGRGLMQIDYDFHEFARIGNWQSPRENILYGCKVLNEARNFFMERTNLREEALLRAILAAYNGGATATLTAIQTGQGVDASTTGGDYSKDVFDRSGWFQLHGWR